MGIKAIRISGRLKVMTAAVLIIITFYSVRSLLFETKYYAPVDASSLVNAVTADGTLTYSQALKSYEEQGAKPVKGNSIELQAASYHTASEDAMIKVVQDETALGQEVLDWGSAKGWVEWNVDIPESGLYEIAVNYLPSGGTSASIIRGIMMDGGYPFLESASIEFERYWKDKKYPYDRNSLGNEVRSPQVEIEGWKLKDAAKYESSSLPLKYYLTKGKHTLRLVGIREPMKISNLLIKAPESIPDYKEYTGNHPAAAAQKEWFQMIEAEQFVQKSGIGIQKYAMQEPYMSPDSKGRIVYNSLGGERWKNPGDWVEWNLEVPADGWYVLDIKFRQIYKGRSKVYRTIMIDGRVPFAEMLHYPFHYEREFDIHTLQDNEGQTFRFYLEKGTHSLKMIADSSLLQPATTALSKTLADLRTFDSEMRSIVGDYGKFGGENADVNRTWEMKKYVPDIDQQVGRFIKELEDICAYMNGLNGTETDLTSTINMSIRTLQDLQQDVDKIPNRLADIAAIQSQISTWLTNVSDQPLLLDYMVLKTPDAKTGLKRPTQLEKWAYSAISFFRTFYMEYREKKHIDEGTINVWIQRGRDYVDLLQELVDQEFTPATGIKVKLNLMPNPNVLILGNAAGNQPDAALGIGMESPVDFAMRGATVDLSTLPGFDEVKKRFHPGVMRSYTYNEGVYGLPETQSFSAFFYRTDIFEKLHLTPPDTWEDVYDILPTLQENGMTYFYPAKDYVPFFYQNNVEFYTKDGKTTELNGEAAIKPFTEWMDLFQKYYLPMEVPAFFNHFRYGDIPAGVADFNTYVLLSVAAPDIAGHWKMIPVPGTRMEDGTVSRWTQQSTTSMMIMKKSKKQDKAWAFLKWWTSSATQLRYAQDIESFFGMEYRWNSANLEALMQSPWPAEDLESIKEQARWIKNVPLVPGYYYLNREMDFAWNYVLLDGMPEKEALEKAALSLQREMKRKQEEFGYSDSMDIRIPQVDEPYNGGEEASDD
ncbi:extracellular solute-binding protein [Paenibacillus eucommiae]|uniref:ABC-type glycerol-3-phosphate transport system substrate-binding protein n=1 Tax=Paenibacillus eucommiae TaxID=1355755 RepID=A0ABS4IZU9_9BACL|nr:extracellular solute-binding protein [Paenibacillus eucommiae]MBP1993107.1 ABC-type glycerol-3-phosphate transport system substrate-binding protein [Paenibacillus eucommiae]